jgi:hypothetical protein
MKFYNDLTEMIGNTPLLRLARLSKKHKLYAKCEFMNPLSLKDRPVFQIVADAERNGTLKPGCTLIETTSGNSRTRGITIHIQWGLPPTPHDGNRTRIYPENPGSKYPG